MSNSINYDKIRGLVCTEKSSQQVDLRKYHFKIDYSCSKEYLSLIIKKAFGVDVKKINIINVKSKTKRFKGVEGKRSAYKKAIVSLKEGQIINFGS